MLRWHLLRHRTGIPVTFYWLSPRLVADAISPNSASCERVFALLESMFGDEQMRSLADQLRASLMLAYNERRVG